MVSSNDALWLALSSRDHNTISRPSTHLWPGKDLFEVGIKRVRAFKKIAENTSSYPDFYP
jgi:hypothetical protein